MQHFEEHPVEATEKPKKKPAHLNPDLWFKPGVVTNPRGRPKGARSKLGEAFIADMYEAWQSQGKEVINRVIEEKPWDFLRSMVSILPKEMSVKVSTLDDMNDDDIRDSLERLRDLALAIDHQAAGEGAVAAPGEEQARGVQALRQAD